MSQVHNPVLPYNGPIPGGMFPGRCIRLSGTIPIGCDKFAVNLMVGGTGDVALHVSPHMHSKHVVRNSIQHRQWGHEEKHGHMPLYPGQTFELLIMCDPHHYKIAFNGAHYTEFHHRIPFQSVTNLGVDGNVNIHSISFEGGSHSAGGMAFPPHMPHVPGSAPYPAGGPHHHSSVPPFPATGYPVPGAAPYPAQPGYPAHGAAPYPHQPGYPVPGAALYPQQPGYPGGYATKEQYPNYPHSPTGHKKPGLLDKAGMAVAGALGASALAGGLGGHKYNKLGGLGGAGLGATLAGAAMTGHLSPKKAMKKQMKNQKKALKYGIPIAGAGLGAYALHKGMHKMHHHGHHRHSSSSSSSSSD